MTGVDPRSAKLRADAELLLAGASLEVRQQAAANLLAFDKAPLDLRSWSKRILAGIATEQQTAGVYVRIADVLDATYQPPPPPLPQWTTTWEQDFSKIGALDMKSVWRDWGPANYGDQGGQHEASFGLMRNVRIEGGELILRLVHEDFTVPAGYTPTVAHYTGARLQSRTSPLRPGSAFEWQGRMTLDVRGAVWHASIVAGDDSELDNPERFVSLQHDRQVAIQKYPPGIVQQYHDLPSDELEHVWRIEWACPTAPDQITFARDGLVTHAVVASFITSNPQDVRVQAACGGPNDPTLPELLIPAEVRVKRMKVEKPAA